jgi:hypothetical protein
MLSSTIHRDYSGTNLSLQHNIKTIDPRSIREEPDPPELDLNTSATLQVGLLEDVVDAIDHVSEHIRFQTEGSDLIISGKNDTDNTRAIIEDVTTGGDADSLFSLDYTETCIDSLKAIGIDAFQIELAEEFPMVVTWEKELNGATVTGEWLQAPRIHSD